MARSSTRTSRASSGSASRCARTSSTPWPTRGPRPRSRTSTSSENTFERPSGRLVEVYRPVWTPNGSELLFEVYGDYAPVAERASDLWRGFAGLLTSAILLLLVLMAPLLWQLLSRLRSAQRQREALLQRAVDASDEERRRIAVRPARRAGAGPRRQLAGGQRRRGRGGQCRRAEVARIVHEAGQTIRSSVASLRSLLVDIYPARLADAGLPAALADLGRPLEARGVVVDVVVDPAAAAALDVAGQRLAHRIATEALRNVARHSRATRATLSLERDESEAAHPVLLDRDRRRGGLRPRPARPARGALRHRSRSPTWHGRRRGAGALVRPGKGTQWRSRLPAMETR